MTVTTTNQDPAPPGEAPPRRQRPPTARTRRTGRPRSRYSARRPRTGPPLVRRGDAPRPPLFRGLRGHRDRARPLGRHGLLGEQRLLRLGVVHDAARRGLLLHRRGAFLALEWVQRRVRRNRRQPERATAPVLAPAAFRAKAKLWPQRRRWSAPEGTLVLNDECIAFESPGRHHRGAVAVPGPRSPNYDCTGASRGARHSAGTSPSVSRVPGPSS